METRAFIAVLDKLKDKRFVAIVGRPGDGKTTLAYQALHVLHKEHKMVPIITNIAFFDCSPEVMSGTKTSIFLDDLCGIYTVEKDVQSKLLSKSFILQLRGLIGRGNYLIIAMRKDIFLQSQIQLTTDLFKKSNVVDLTVPEMSLLKAEKELLLKQIPGIKEGQVSEILNSENIEGLQIGFPQCVELMKEHGAFNYEQIKSTPMRFLREKMSVLQKECTEKFAALVLGFANDGQICVAEMDKLRKDLPTELESGSINKQKLIEYVIVMTGTYFMHSKVEDIYTLCHESIMEGLALTLWEDLQYRHWFVKHCPQRFLSRFTNICDDDFYLSRSQPVLLSLFERLCSLLETQSDDLFDRVGSLRIWDDQTTVKDFLQYAHHWNSNCLYYESNIGYSIVVHAAKHNKTHLVKALLSSCTDSAQIYAALRAATEYSHLDTINLFLPVHKDIVDTKIIFLAIRGRNIEIYKAITRYMRVDVKRKTRSEIYRFLCPFVELDVTVIEEICLSGNLNLLQFVILSENVDMSACLNKHRNLLEYAAYSGSIECVQYLLKEGANKCCHLVWWAACSGSYDMVKHLLNIGCELKNSNGMSCEQNAFIGDITVDELNETNEIESASASGNIDIVRYLIETEQTLRMEITEDPSRAVYFSYFSGSLDIIKYYESITSIADIHNTDLRFFESACMGGNIEIVKYFVFNYPDILTIREESESPLVISGYSGSVDIVKYLMTKGCNMLDKNTDGCTVLHYACQNGKVELVQYLVEYNSDLLTIRDNKGRSALLEAGKSGSVEIVKYLVSKGCDVFDKDDDGETVLHYACRNGKLELIKYLVDNYPDILTIRSTLGRSTFLLIGHTGSVEIVKYMISKGCDVLDQDNYGWTVLHYACKKGKLGLVQYLVDEYPGVLRVRSKIGTSSFLLAAISGSLEMMKYLVSKQCNVLDQDNEGLTALHYACQHGKLNLVKYLVENYPDILTIKEESKPPLVISGYSGSVDIVKYLMTKGCNILDKDTDGCTVLHYACQKGNVELVQYLVEYNSDLLTIKDNTGRSALLEAGKSGSAEIAKYLISKGSNVCDKDDDGETVLHYACRNGKLELVKYLVDKYPDTLTIRSTSGRSTFLLIGHSGSVEIVKYMISKGCDVLDQDNYGWTVLHYACKKGKLGLVQYLVDEYPGVLRVRSKIGTSSFLLAAISGSLEMMKYLVSKQCNVLDQDNEGLTALHYACQHGKLNLVKYLVEKLPRYY